MLSEVRGKTNMKLTRERTKVNILVTSNGNWQGSLPPCHRILWLKATFPSRRCAAALVTRQQRSRKVSVGRAVACNSNQHEEQGNQSELLKPTSTVVSAQLWPAYFLLKFITSTNRSLGDDGKKQIEDLKNCLTQWS